MARESVELFLARRISSQRGERSGAMVGIARICVALSVAVMLISLSVIGGFKDALHEKLTGMEAHITVEPAGSRGRLEGKTLTRSADFEQTIGEFEGFESITPFASRAGMVKSLGALQGALLRGVDVGYDSLFYASKLVEGRLPRIGGEERKKDVLISKTLADRLEVGVDDKLEFVFTSEGNPMRRDLYKVCGIFSTGMSSMEQNLTLTDIRNVQRLGGWEQEQVSGYMIMAESVAAMEPLTSEVRAEAYLAGGEEMWRTTNLKDNYPQIFDWLATHDINGAVIIVIMIAVALLNMITALLIIIFERIRTIGTLKALGMRNRGVRRLFLWCATRVILSGMAWGNLVAVVLLMVQRYTGVVALDPEAYMLSEVPVAFEWSHWVGVDVLVPIVLLALLSIPVSITSRVKPDQTLKYQ